jgi:toxin ParE1/3/4
VKRSLSIEYAEAARRDLTGLWFDYSTVSEALADKIIRRLEVKIFLLTTQPQMGRLRPEFGFEGLRSVAVNPHVIFYTIAEGGALWIHRVVDGRRNLYALFEHGPV